jgi:protein-tyrosine phosphatase
MTQPTLDELARSINLRDVGGAPVGDGREVRRGVMFRSAALSELTPAERAVLAGLGLRSIVDLRYNSERAEHPTPWEDFGCSNYWAHDYEPAGGGLSDLFAEGALTRDGAREMMLRAYQHIPFSHTEGLQRLFRALAGGEGPVLFHCTSGKDRTGVSAALVLSAIGVPREAIVADYVASLNFDILASAAFRDCPADRLEALEPLYSVHPDYLDAMFGAIEREEGSVEAFLDRAVGLQPSEKAALRQNLVA